MRSVYERQVWPQLKKRRAAQSSSFHPLGWSAFVDLAAPCTVIGGFNGSGKSRALRQLQRSLGSDGVLLDLHHLCEQALIILRSRDDFDDMAEEFGAIGPDDDRRGDVERVVGREYDSIEWFALEVEPADVVVAERFCWSGSQPLIPYFRAEYRGRSYTARDMGLGEFSVHFLFWILEQYRDAPSLTLLLDEPDAFLPPVGVSRLLARLLRMCAARDWSLVITSHSEEMISLAVEEQSFVMVGADVGGNIRAVHSLVDPRVAEPLLARPSPRCIYFCEDESAFYLLDALLNAIDPLMAQTSIVMWTRGEGDLTSLRRHLPRPMRSPIDFALVYDGDQRDRVERSTDAQWRAIFLPTDDDPDTALKSLRDHPSLIAERLAVAEAQVHQVLDRIEGSDPHDWVNEISHAFGRSLVLSRLATLWCSVNPEAVAAFAQDLGGAR